MLHIPVALACGKAPYRHRTTRGVPMTCKALLFAVPSLSLALIFAVPCAAMQTVPAPRNGDGTPRFSEPDAAPRSLSSGPGQVTTTFGNGSFSFGVTSNYGWGTGNQG